MNNNLYNMVSILAAIFNGARTIKSSIDSVLAQNYTNFELIIIDDCSTDDTQNIIYSYNDKRIRYYRNISNIGQTKSLNIALSKACGGLIARIDADDLWISNKLSKQIEYLESNKNISIVGTFAYKINFENEIIGIAKYPLNNNDIKFTSILNSPLCHVSVLMKREAIIAAGGYPEVYKYAADFALWSTLLYMGYNVSNIPECLTLYREDDTTYGAQQKIGIAGDETAKIIITNVKILTGMDITFEEAKSLSLIFFPLANYSRSILSNTYRKLAIISRIIYGKEHLHSIKSVVSIISWALLLRWSNKKASNYLTIFEDIIFLSCSLFLFPSILCSLAIAIFLKLLGIKLVRKLRIHIYSLIKFFKVR